MDIVQAFRPLIKPTCRQLSADWFVSDFPKSCSEIFTCKKTWGRTDLIAEMRRFTAVVPGHFKFSSLCLSEHARNMPENAKACRIWSSHAQFHQVSWSLALAWDSCFNVFNWYYFPMMQSSFRVHSKHAVLRCLDSVPRSITYGYVDTSPLFMVKLGKTENTESLGWSNTNNLSVASP